MRSGQSLHRYTIAYHPLFNYGADGNGGSAGFDRCHTVQRRWRYLLAMIVASILLIFCYWTFQTVSTSPFLFEHASEEPPFLSELKSEQSSAENNTNPTSFNDTSTRISQNATTLVNAAATLSLTNFSIPPQQKGTAQVQCPEVPPNLVGPVPVWMDGPEMAKLEQLYPWSAAGGHGWPQDCVARNRVAIIVPYRDREQHLRIFLHNLHAFLHKQQLDYAIFIVEQIAGQTFNRGKLMNVGFVEANRLYGWHCFIFHDVDLLPEDDRNLYTCPQQPRHMSVAVDKFHYKLLYSTLFGGVEALTRKQFEKMNGFPNDYWGWGGEDDDISARITLSGFTISRYPTTIARYKMVKHTREQLNPVNDCRNALLKMTKQRWRRDGLSNLNYRLISTQFGRLYTNITVDLLEDESRRALSAEHIKKGC